MDHQVSAGPLYRRSGTLGGRQSPSESDQEDIASLYKRLSFAGIDLVTLAEGEISELHVGLKGTMNALFLKDLANKTRRGLRGRVEAGRSGGGNSYGYDVVHTQIQGGDVERGKRVTNDAQAEIVRRIFRVFAAGKSPRRIAFDLNREGVPGPTGKGWSPSTINGNAARGTGILNNELYIGRLIWNRLRYVKDPNTGKRVTNDAQAEIVRRIFRVFAAGKSPRRIAFDLNREGVPGPTGKGWSPSTINGNAARGTGILNNELYIGRLIWNRLRYVKDPNTGKRVSRLNPESEWITKSVPDLCIVDQELWEAVKARQKAIKKNTRPDLKAERPFWERGRPKYLLSGLLKCGACGGSYSKISANLFGCATARNKGTCDNRLNIRRDRLEDLILDGLKSQLMEPDLLQGESRNP